MIPDKINLSETDWLHAPESFRQLTLAMIQQVRMLESALADTQAQAIQKADSMRTCLSILAEKNSKKSRKEQLAVFVSERPITREAKIADGLRRNGWRVILLFKENNWIDTQECFDEAHQFNSPEEALALCCSYTPKVYHIFAIWNYKTASLLMKHKPGKIVFDNYDTLGEALQPDRADQFKNEIIEEKYCLENADALTSRTLGLQIQKRSKKYSLRAPRIFFPDYCWNVPQADSVKKEDGVHFVYAGGCPQKLDEPNEWGCCDRAFIQKITSKQIHYHVYPWAPPGMFEKNYPEHIQYAKENKYFHFHEPVPYQQLIKEISRYHFGILTSSERAYENGDWTYNNQGLRYTLANKLFDYVDARLGVIIFHGQLMRWMFTRTGLGIESSRENFEQGIEAALQKLDCDDYKNTILRTQREYSMPRQARRLIRLYNSL